MADTVSPAPQEEAPKQVADSLSEAPASEEEHDRALELKGISFEFGGRFKGLGTFLNEVQVEFKKISWPTRQRIAVETGVVIAVCAFLTWLVIFYDWIFDGVANRVFYGQ